MVVKCLKELADVRMTLSATQATADASSASAQSAQLQCLTLFKELDAKNKSIKVYEDRVNRLGEQLDHLQKDLETRPSSTQVELQIHLPTLYGNLQLLAHLVFFSLGGCLNHLYTPISRFHGILSCGHQPNFT